MKPIHLLYLPVIACLFSCNTNEHWYDAISEAEYNTYKPLDTLAETPQLLAIKVNGKGRYDGLDVVNLRVKRAKGYEYYALESDVSVESDTTFTQQQDFFVSGEHTRGIWVYTAAYNNSEGQGLRFSVDSLPPGYTKATVPTAEGIYFYKHNRLDKISTAQTRDAFHDYAEKHAGFYFIPNSGTLFKRHFLSELE